MLDGVGGAVPLAAQVPGGGQQAPEDRPAGRSSSAALRRSGKFHGRSLLCSGGQRWVCSNILKIFLKLCQT